MARPTYGVALQGDGGAAVRVRGRGVGQRAGGGHRRAGAEQRGIGVAGDVEGERLASFIRRAGADRGRPRVHRLRPGVFVDRLVAALGEARRIVDRGQVDREVLRGRSVDAAVRGAAVDLHAHAQVGGAVRIRCGGEAQRAA